MQKGKVGRAQPLAGYSDDHLSSQIRRQAKKHVHTILSSLSLT
jgi:hypothetical protein